jgi:hypothetical protein
VVVAPSPPPSRFAFTAPKLPLFFARTKSPGDKAPATKDDDTSQELTNPVDALPDTAGLEMGRAPGNGEAKADEKGGDELKTSATGVEEAVVVAPVPPPSRFPFTTPKLPLFFSRAKTPADQAPAIQDDHAPQELTNPGDASLVNAGSEVGRALGGAGAEADEKGGDELEMSAVGVEEAVVAAPAPPPSRFPFSTPMLPFFFARTKAPGDEEPATKDDDTPQEITNPVDASVVGRAPGEGDAEAEEAWGGEVELSVTEVEGAMVDLQEEKAAEKEEVSPAVATLWGRFREVRLTTKKKKADAAPPMPVSRGCLGPVSGLWTGPDNVSWSSARMRRSRRRLLKPRPRPSSSLVSSSRPSPRAAKATRPSRTTSSRR